MRTAFCVALLSVALWPLHAISAEPITFRFHGTVSQVLIDEGPAPPGIGPGSSFDGTYSFDPEATDSAMNENHGVYHLNAPSAVRVSIDSFRWHADKSFVSVINGGPSQQDTYEAGASRMTLDSHPELREELDIWIFQLHLEGSGSNLSDPSLPLTPPELSAWDEARLLMIGDSSMGPLDPVPAVMITASLLELELAADFEQDGDVDSGDLANWQAGFGARCAGHVQGDANGDRLVDGADFLLWQRQSSFAAPSVIAAAAPEPNSLALATALAAVVVCRRRSRKLLS